MRNSTIKVVTSIVILLLMVIGIGAYSLKILKSTSKKIENHINQVETYVKASEWEKVKGELSGIEKEWAGTEKVWAILLDHIEIDNIDTTLSRMTNYVELQEKTLTLNEAATLKQYIKHIPEKEAFTLKNIL